MALVTKNRIRSEYVNHASRTCAYSQTRQSTRNLPNSPKEIRSGPVISITYLEFVLILSIKFHPHLYSLSVFQDFQFPRFLFPSSTPQCPRILSELKIRHLRHDVFLYIKFHKDPITIREIDILNFHNFPSLLPPYMVESEEGLLSSEFVQVPDTPLNFHRPNTSRSTEIAKVLEILPLPNSPKESRSSPVMWITYLKLWAFSSHQVSSISQL